MAPGFFWLLLTLAAATGSGVAGEDITCPAELDVTAQAAEVPGWQGMGAGPDRARLERMSVRTAPEQSDGVPQTGYMRMEQAGRKTIVARWDLTEARASHPALWLVCHYAGTSIVLARQLPEEVDRCEYRVEATDTGLQEAANCR